MLSLTPQLPPTEVTAAYSVLMLISDAAAAKQRLDELVVETDKANKATAEALALVASAQEQKIAADAALDEAAKIRVQAERDIADMHADHGVKTKQLEGHMAAHAVKSAQVAEWENTVNTKNDAALAEIESRESALSARDATIEARDAESVRLNNEAKELKAEVEKRLAAFAALSGGKRYEMTAETGKVGSDFQ